MSVRSPETIRIGTRRSALAQAQAGTVADRLRAARPGARVEIVAMSTRGDRTPGPLRNTGGKGLFCAALEEALRAGRIDLAVHSAKDVPAELVPDMCIAAVPERADPRDALVCRVGGGPDELPVEPRVGTGSARRAAQFLLLRPDARILPLRGNVDTRLAKVLSEHAELDATVLAMAGLVRLGLGASEGNRIHPLDAWRFVPAAGQGALAVEARAGSTACEWAAAIDESTARDALEAERSVLRAVGADCHSCVGVHLAPHSGGWRGVAMATDAEERPGHAEAHGRSARAVGEALADALVRGGFSV